MGFVEGKEFDLGWKQGERNDLVDEGLGLRSGENVGGERMVSICKKLEWLWEEFHGRIRGLCFVKRVKIFFCCVWIFLMGSRILGGLDCLVGGNHKIMSKEYGEFGFQRGTLVNNCVFWVYFCFRSFGLDKDNENVRFSNEQIRRYSKVVKVYNRYFKDERRDKWFCQTRKVF